MIGSLFCSPACRRVGCECARAISISGARDRRSGCKRRRRGRRRGARQVAATDRSWGGWGCARWRPSRSGRGLAEA
eukprot:6152128-Pyramimonas_sp.AAC.1